MMRRALVLSLVLFHGLTASAGQQQARKGDVQLRKNEATTLRLKGAASQLKQRGRFLQLGAKKGPAKKDTAQLKEEQKLAEEKAKLARIQMNKGPGKKFVYTPMNTKVQQAKILGENLAEAPFKADYVDIGMGPTGMMTMLAAIASGHTAVGVEIRGEPQRGVHQNIRVDWYHTLARIDEMMLEKYGPEGIPKLPSGKPFILHDFFYSADRVGGHLDFHEIYGVGDDKGQNVAGRLQKISFEDSRHATLEENGGKGKLFVLPAPKMPLKADSKALNPDMKQVLDSPSTFQAALINYELMLRSYLHAMEKQDLAAGRKPRVKMYENHRVAIEDDVSAGYIEVGGGKRRIVIEEIVDGRDAAGKANRIRKPGSQRIDLGTPTRFSLTAGFGGGSDAKTLGYEQENVVYEDPHTGQKVAARQNWLVGEVTANVGGQLIRRISSKRDPLTGELQTVRQIAVGHESAPNVAWVPVQVPDFMTFNPIDAGKVPPGTPHTDKAYIAARQELIKDYFIQEVSEVTHVPQADIRKMRMFYGPNFFTLQEKLGKTARLAANGNVAGDLMGNGHFLTSGGAMTGMIGHANRYIDYWQSKQKGMSEAQAATILEDGIRTDSEAWLHVSIKEFFDVSPVNFGAERAKAIGIKGDGTPIAAGGTQKNFGLAQVLGQTQWSTQFQKLRNGDFGKAHVDFYVPKNEVDVTAASHITLHHLDADGKQINK